MNKQEQVQQMTTYMANFVSHIAKVLPDDIIKKLDELGAQEDAPLSKVIYETMKRNQKLAKELNRPSCQDTGVLQFWVKCGVDFPLIGEVEGLLKEAVVKSTFEAPLRHNSVETFDEFNTGLNVGIITSAFLIFRTPYRLFCKNASESLPSSPATFSGTSPSHPPGAGCPRCRLSSSPPHERGRQSAVFPNR